MPKIISPVHVAPPSSNYAQAILVDDAKHWLHVSGQIGVRSDGTLAGGTEAQMEECWKRIGHILAEARMAFTDIVKVTAFLTDSADVGIYRQVRDRMLGGHTAASTLLVVSALAHPDWKVEIEVVAAR